MQRVAITGCSSRFAQVLLPLLEVDPNIERINRDTSRNDYAVG